MRSQENNSLKYRHAIVEAKRIWDTQPKNKVYENKKVSQIISDQISKLNIYGGGIAILSRAEKVPFLLYSPLIQKHFKIKENVDDYEYLNTPYKIFENNPPAANFVDLLFFISRDTTKPEYVTNISDVKSNQPFEYPFQLQLRTEYEILHCSSGEILFFSLLWRLLIELVYRSNSLQSIYSKNIFTTKGNGFIWCDLFAESKHLTVEQILSRKLSIAYSSRRDNLSETVITANELFAQSFISENSVKYIFEDLGLFKKEHLLEFNRYVQNVFKGKFTELTCDNADQFTINLIDSFASICNYNPNSVTLGYMLEDLHKKARFPILPYYFMLFFDKKKELKEHIVFPIWYTATPDTKYIYDITKQESAVLHALYTIKPVWLTEHYSGSQWYTANNSIDEIKISANFENYINDLTAFFTAIAKPIVDKEYYSKESAKNIARIIFQATRAAISQVMARNGSHNIGSHVLNQLTRDLKNIDFTQNNYQESIFNLADHHEKQKDCFIDGKPIPKCPELILAQAEYFNAYVKNRMEYLGDLAINTPLMSSSKELFNDLFRDFDKIRFLLDNISGLGSQFKYSFRFIIDGCEITKDNYNIHDIKLAVPNDVTGCQAFYNILENIIRNTAKHSGEVNSDKICKFTIDIKNAENAKDYWQINVYDDVEKDDIDEVVVKQNKRLNKNILDETTNKLRQGSLGMIEMDASAAYLRMLDINDINDSEYDLLHNEQGKTNNIWRTVSGKLPILHANKYVAETSKEAKCLGYQFYIAKPKEVLFVVSKEENRKRLEGLNDKPDVDVIKLDAFRKALLNNQTFVHQFVVADSALEDEIFQKHKAQFSRRVLYLQDYSDVCTVTSNKIWHNWISNYMLSDFSSKYYKLQGSSPQGRCPEILLSDHKFTLESLNAKLKSDSLNYLTFEVLSSLAKSKLPDFNKIENCSLTEYITKCNTAEYQETRNQLGEAAQNKILVIDERIQQFAMEDYEYEGVKAPHYLFYQAMNVFMPYIADKKPDKTKFSDFKDTFQFNLSNKELNISLIDQIECFLTSINADFLVIHYGILERVYGNNKDTKIREILNNWTSLFPKMEIVITSGRTRLEGLPCNVRFVNLAPLLSAFVDIRCKYIINKILTDSRI